MPTHPRSANAAENARLTSAPIPRPGSNVPQGSVSTRNARTCCRNSSSGAVSAAGDTTIIGRLTPPRPRCGAERVGGPWIATAVDAAERLPVPASAGSRPELLLVNLQINNAACLACSAGFRVSAPGGRPAAVLARADALPGTIDSCARSLAGVLRFRAVRVAPVPELSGGAGITYPNQI